MNGFDIILIVSLVAFMVNGFAKGLFAKVFSLAALLGGIIIAAKYGGEIGSFLSRFIGFGPMLCGVIGVAAIFIVLFVISGILTKGFKKISVLKVFDKLGGALFGLLEGAVMLSLLLLFLAIFSIPPPGPALEKSFMYGPVREFAPNVYKTFISKHNSESYLDKFFFPSHK